MAGYADTRQMIIDTLMGRMAGTEIQPEDHQKFALQITDYVRSVELVAGNATPIGFADADTVPVQPDNGQAVYLSSVGGAQTVTFSNFIGQNGSPISVTSTENVIKLVTLLWNGQYWSSQVTSVNAVRDTTNGYLFMGVATPTTIPGTPDQKVFYIAVESGEYSNFSNIVLNTGETAILKYNNTWTKELLDINVALTQEEINVGNNSLNKIDFGYVSDKVKPIFNLELGNITIRATEWIYSDNKKRVRTKEGCTIHLYPGDIIGLNSYTNARFYLGWLKSDGTRGVAGWLTDDYTCVNEGDYIILISNLTDSIQTSVYELGNLLKIIRNNSLEKTISGMKLIANSTEYQISGTQYDGQYVGVSGNVVSSPSYSSTEIDVNKGDIVLVNARGTNLVSVIAKKVGTSYSPQIVMLSGGYHDYTYLAKEDCTIRISYQTTTGVTHTIQAFASNNVFKQVIPDAIPSQRQIDEISERTVFGVNPNKWNGYFYAHLFIDKISQDATNVIIPSESLFDIQIAKRLGFKCIEANVAKTSDNKYIVMHGHEGKFGYEVTDLDGEYTYADTMINSVTFDWIRNNIQYRSDVEKYRTFVPSIEEFLTECKIQGMFPFVTTNHQELVDIVDGIMGKGNYIAYNSTRALTSAPISTYLKLTTKQDILDRCNIYGAPFIYCMGNTTTFTDEELLDIVNTLHQNGYMISAAATYLSESEVQRCRRLGFDLMASKFQINDIDYGNLCNLIGDTTFGDFNTNGTIVGGNLLLGNGNTISPANTISSVFCGGASLRIKFNGTIHLQMGDYINNNFTSDGKQSMWFSTYVLNGIPTFNISAIENVTIENITFKASRL